MRVESVAEAGGISRDHGAERRPAFTKLRPIYSTRRILEDNPEPLAWPSKASFRSVSAMRF